MNILGQAQTGVCHPQVSSKMNPSKPTAVPPVIIIPDETRAIPDPFPFPATYSANVDVALHRGEN